MSGDARNVFVAAEGVLYVADTSAAAPTDAETPVGGDFTDVGGFGKDGLGIRPSMETSPFRFFGSFFDDLLLVTSRGLQLTVTLYEWNQESVKLAFDGGEVTGSGDSWAYTPPTPRSINEKSVILDLFYGDKIHRWYFPRVRVSEVGDISFTNETPNPIPLTFTVLQSNIGGSGSGEASTGFLHFVANDTNFGLGA